MKLYTKGQVAVTFPRPVIARVTTRRIEQTERRRDYCIFASADLNKFQNDFLGYAGLISELSPTPIEGYLSDAEIPTIVVAPNLQLSDGDVVSLEPSGFIRILYRKQSPHNAIFATERCNSFCLMCSQPQGTSMIPTASTNT